MKNKYYDLIDQTFDFPQDEFMVVDGNLMFNDIDLMEIIEKYGTPLKITYLPKISQQIQRAKRLFKVAMAKADYQGGYNYSYCTKSSQFAFVVHEALRNDIHLETSSAYDLDLVRALGKDGSVNKEKTYIICNGFKRPQYIKNIAALRKEGRDTAALERLLAEAPERVTGDAAFPSTGHEIVDPRYDWDYPNRRGAADEVRLEILDALEGR